jgi:phosphocarrier protein FPr
VLSADFALDMLDDDRRRRVVLSDAPLVEGAVAAATVAGAGGSLDDVVREARSALLPKSTSLDLTPAAPPDADASGSLRDASEARTAVLPVTNTTGLHARPAARFVGTVGAHDATVTVTNVTTGTGPVRGDSFSAIGTLGARQGHEIRVAASGPDAAAVIAALRSLAEDGYGDGVGPSVPERTPPTPARARPVGASPGTAIGPVRHLVLPDLPDTDAEPGGEPSEERSKLSTAVAEARAGIERTRNTTRRVAGSAEAAIFDAHLALLDDVELGDEVERRIAAGESALAAWRATIAALAGRFRDLDDPYQRERAPPWFSMNSMNFTNYRLG